MSTYGFTSIARDVSKALPNPGTPSHQEVAELPNSAFAQAILRYADVKLPKLTLNHSLRVYLYSIAIIVDHFPKWDLDNEVILATCLLHDIGTTQVNMEASKMSFEFYGGLVARDVILELLKDQLFADAVAEAVIRHQDLGETGNITTLGLILQIATILDNVGKCTELIHPKTLAAINEKHSRKGWKGCFAAVIDAENSQKPWGHTSALGPEFKEGVLGNSETYGTSEE